MYYYSAATEGFYHDSVHGALVSKEPDPAWDGEGEQPFVMVVLRESKIPEDAVPVTESEWRALMDAHTKAGTRIAADKNGKPVIVEG